MAALRLPPRVLRFFSRHLSLYPPFIGAGIRVVTNEPENGLYRTRMRLRFHNRNLVGTHFGGSLYAMCDPFLAIILLHHYGRDYEVWDRSAEIEYLKPGRGVVEAEFQIEPEEIDRIRREADSGTVRPVFVVDVTDSSGDVVARVTKTLHVRRRRPG